MAIALFLEQLEYVVVDAKMSEHLYIQSQDASMFQLEHFVCTLFQPEHPPGYAPAPRLWNLTSTSLRSASETWNMARGFRFMKLATNTSGIWPMRVL
jgi:hypothetical protein